MFRRALGTGFRICPRGEWMVPVVVIKTGHRGVSITTTIVHACMQTLATTTNYRLLQYTFHIHKAKILYAYYATQHKIIG